MGWCRCGGPPSVCLLVYILFCDCRPPPSPELPNRRFVHASVLCVPVFCACRCSAPEQFLREGRGVWAPEQFVREGRGVRCHRLCERAKGVGPGTVFVRELRGVRCHSFCKRAGVCGPRNSLCERAGVCGPWKMFVREGRGVPRNRLGREGRGVWAPEKPSWAPPLCRRTGGRSAACEDPHGGRVERGALWRLTLAAPRENPKSPWV